MLAHGGLAQMVNQKAVCGMTSLVVVVSMGEMAASVHFAAKPAIEKASLY